MSEMITGGCLCGEISFEYTDSPGPAAYCHCTDCRRITGSAFNISVPVSLAFFEIVSGSPKAFTKRADSGHELTRYFCGDCGSPIYVSSPRHPEIVYVKAGAFDDPDLVKPSHQSWTGSVVAWSKIDDDLPGYPKHRPGNRHNWTETWKK